MCDKVILEVNLQSGYQLPSALAGRCQLHSLPITQTACASTQVSYVTPIPEQDGMWIFFLKDTL